MVLVELGQKISGALAQMSKENVIDEGVLDQLLKEIGNALIASDVNVRLVLKLRQNVKKAVKLEDLGSGVNKRKVIQKVVFDELVALLDPGKKPYVPKKGKCAVYMFVGLQGAGKTTTVGKLAAYYKKRGWNPALVCADTFRAGAFDQLKQNATRIKVPYYGSYYETDPVKTAQEGVEKFRDEGHDLIIVDTSGRHKQEAALFDEMQDVAAAVDPDEILFVMDSTIGQAAFDQAKAFHDAVKVGSVIITKLDGHAKGGGALSAVAATGSPVVFYGTGEHMDALDPFEADSFVSKLLGLGDMKGLMKSFAEVLPEGTGEELVNRISQGKFTLRDMYEQLSSVMKMGPVSKIMEMMPGMGQLTAAMGANGQDGTDRLKKMLCIMDSMTDEELDSEKPITQESRKVRIARGAGVPLQMVEELFVQHKTFSKMFGNLKNAGKGHLSQQKQLQQLQGALPPQLMQQLGGAGNLQAMMKQMEGMNIPGLGKM
jgi:signal recognition particle subunit SRP54